MLKALRGIGVDIFWHRPLKKMENVYMYTESASYAKNNLWYYAEISEEVLFIKS